MLRLRNNSKTLERSL